MTLPFYQVDVFSSEAYRGNPVAVVVALDEAVAARITTEDMKAFARWTNLSETTFVLPPTDASKADYRLRIFTPGTELPFAGHPTLGSCRAWLANGGTPRSPGVIVQECGAGLVTLRIAGGSDASDESSRLAFSAPPLKRSGRAGIADVQAVCNATGLDPKTDIVHAEWIVNGPEWLLLELEDAQTVLSAKLVDGGAAGGSRMWGIMGRYKGQKGPKGADFEVRTFAPSDGIAEDPVTGSFTAGLATWLQKRDGDARQNSFIVSQGSCVQRSGFLHVTESDEPAGTASGNEGMPPLWIGGDAHVLISGHVKI